VYYTLLQAREERGIKDVAISRIEQLSPFPYDMVSTFVMDCRTLIDLEGSRSLLISINTPMLIFFGVKRSP
jgi:hypothetical protein